jgi:hypothetical protein
MRSEQAERDGVDPMDGSGPIPKPCVGGSNPPGGASKVLVNDPEASSNGFTPAQDGQQLVNSSPSDDVRARFIVDIVAPARW